MGSRVDLHLHTTVSDGALRPAELVRAAAAGLPLEVIPGIELSSGQNGEEIHLLGYFLDIDDPHLRAALGRLQEERRAQARAMVARLQDLGCSLDWTRVSTMGQGHSIGRPHIAKALVERGYVASIDEAFSRFLKRGGPAYVEGRKLPPQDAVSMIRAAGGVSSLAHPIIVGADDYRLDLDRLVPALAEAGLEGVEVYYKGYTSEIRASLLAMAARYRLIPTGGSDFHGGGVVADAELGAVEVPPETVERLRGRRRDSGSAPIGSK